MSYVLFISESKLKDSTAINLNVDTNLLLPYVRQAQKLYVETKLGTDLTQKLKDEITAGTLAGAYKTLVDDYIGDMLPNWAFYHAIPFLRFKIEFAVDPGGSFFQVEDREMEFVPEQEVVERTDLSARWERKSN